MALNVEEEQATAVTQALSDSASHSSRASNSSSTSNSSSATIANEEAVFTPLPELPSGQRTLAIRTPQEALGLDEVERMRVFLYFNLAVCAILILVVPLMGTDAFATWLMGATILATVSSALWFLLVIRDASAYRPWMTTVYGLIAETTILAGCYFWGATSAVVMIVPIGTYFLALGRSFRGVLVCHMYISGAHFLLSAAQIAGVVPDVGLFGSLLDSTTHKIGILAAVQVIFLSAFLMARQLRRTTMLTLERLDRAVQDDAKRKALLYEIREELAQARHSGGAGRYSDRIVGSYRLGKVIGRGGMGEVYAGVHTQTNAHAAVKLLTLDAMLDAEVMLRFMRELQIASKLKQPNIVSVFEVSEAGAELPYIAMERLVGETLSDRLRRNPKFETEALKELFAELGRAIQAAHAAGIVHRDLKPSNIFCHREPDGNKVWKILDFGVSKLMDQGNTLTSGAVVGTPAYMAPEQATSGIVVPETDIYSLGVIAYRVLTRRPAFSGRDLPAVLHAVVFGTPPKPSESIDINSDIDFVLAIAMAQEPADRFNRVEDFVSALNSALSQDLSESLRSYGAKLMHRRPWGKRDI